MVCLTRNKNVSIWPYLFLLKKKKIICVEDVRGELWYLICIVLCVGAVGNPNPC